MSDVYEFHVTGLIGPVIESALPELTTAPSGSMSVLSGTANSPAEVERVLLRLGDAGLAATHIVISSSDRWHRQCRAADGSGRAVPVVDDDGPQDDILD